jgi:chromosome segregation ATPase
MSQRIVEPLPPDEPELLEKKKTGVARGAVELYRNINKVDRWSGGGFGLSTVVKIAGWAGLLAIMAVLVTKVRMIQRELDPVAHGVEELQQELDQARSRLQGESQRSMKEIEELRDQARGLRNNVEKTSNLDDKAAHELGEAEAAAKTLSKTFQDQQDALARSLSDLSKTLAQGRGSLQGSSDRAQALQDALGKVQSAAADLQKSMAQLQLAPTQAALAKVQANAEALSDALEKADGKVQSSSDALVQALDKATARANALDAALAKKAERAQAAPAPSLQPARADKDK